MSIVSQNLDVAANVTTWKGMENVVDPHNSTAPQTSLAITCTYCKQEQEPLLLRPIRLEMTAVVW